MTIIIVFIFFILLLILPFLPGIAERVSKHDADPLFINMDYVRDPRYFPKSFKSFLQKATAGFVIGPEIRDVHLSKQEKIQFTKSLIVAADGKINHLLYIHGSLVTGDNAQIIKDAYATGDVSIGVNNIIRVLVAEGKMAIASGTKIERWLDAGSIMTVGENCNLGICASSGDKIYIDQNCLFRRLYGMPIITGNEQAAAALPKADFLPLTSAFVRMKDREIPAGTVIDKHIVFTKDLNIGRNTVFMGDLKSYGNVVIKEDVIIYGSVFADGDIYISAGTKIGGNVFSQKAVYIEKQVVIGRADAVKSVVGKKMVGIEQNVTIYGYVTTEGDGITV